MTFETMNELFWTSPFTVRFGPNGTLIGHDAIANHRQMRMAAAGSRALRNTVITTFGRNFATTNTETMKLQSRASVAKAKLGSVRHAAGASRLHTCQISRHHIR